jgi:hypothetical protein
MQAMTMQLAGNIAQMRKEGAMRANALKRNAPISA